jgi:hypothetical protein
MRVIRFKARIVGQLGHAEHAAKGAPLVFA